LAFPPSELRGCDVRRPLVKGKKHLENKRAFKDLLLRGSRRRNERGDMREGGKEWRVEPFK
jgi:hypothetical protein